MRRLCMGENLTREELKEIENNLIITKHAKERIIERNSSVKEVYDTIREPYIAYFNTDGSINIALNNWQCYIIARSKYEENKYVLLTYKDDVWLSMKKKQELARKGYSRN